MIYEWYSGSDKSAKIPTGIRKFSQLADEVGLADRVSLLGKLLKGERDPNWRGYLMHYLGVQYLDSGKNQEGLAALDAALEQFDPLASNFRDVVGEYGRTLFYVLRTRWSHMDPRDACEYILRALPYVGEMDLTYDDRSQLMALAADAFLQIAEEVNDPRLCRIAAEFGMKAHHLDPDDPYCLEDLVYSFFGSGDVAKAKLAYQQIKSLKVDFEYRERLDQFCKKAFSGKYVTAPNVASDDHD